MNIGNERNHLHIWRRGAERRHWLLGDEWHATLTLRDKYIGSIAKGWWSLGATNINRHFELEIALGGEDSMIQTGMGLPFVGQVHVGLKVPRQLLKSWIYERREWTLRIGYVGRWVELLIASDENMRDTGMVGYYRDKRARPDCANCRHCKEFHENDEKRCITLSETNHGCPPCDCPGYMPESLPWSRLALWPGWHFTFAPRLKDRLLGRMECMAHEGEPFPVVIPLPEGNYPGECTRAKRTWQRKRWPFSRHERVDYWVDMKIAPPVPGKGENDWDCEDDGIYGTGGASVPEAIANVTRAALRARERYGSTNWTPNKGWPAGIAR